MQVARSITVASLTLAQYLELRSIRLHLEGMAAERAAGKISDRVIRKLARYHEELVEAEQSSRWTKAVTANWEFHHTLYKSAEMPELLSMIENIWLRNGPLSNYMYPHAVPSYENRHQHMNILDALQNRDAAGVRQALQDDLVEGGRPLVRLLERMDLGEVSPEELRRTRENSEGALSDKSGASARLPAITRRKSPSAASA